MKKASFVICWAIEKDAQFNERILFHCVPELEQRTRDSAVPESTGAWLDIS